METPFEWGRRAAQQTKNQNVAWGYSRAEAMAELHPDSGVLSDVIANYGVQKRVAHRAHVVVERNNGYAPGADMLEYREVYGEMGNVRPAEISTEDVTPEEEAQIRDGWSSVSA